MTTSRDRLWTARFWARYNVNNSRPGRALRAPFVMRSGIQFAHELGAPTAAPAISPSDTTNPLEEYFDAVTEGPGIWKWRHYFDVYHRHLAKFIDREVHVVEIGVYSGGSLPMWRRYFGHRSQIYGVDVAPECRAHEQEGVRVFIGDQGSPAFWREFRRDVPRIDVVIDDGSHEAADQIASLRCLLPHMANGGVYICEDILGPSQQFNSFLDGISRSLSEVGDGCSIVPRPWHEHIASVHRYPQIAAIERPDGPVPRFESVRHGTSWEPNIRF
jgi:hypothetical protein